MPRTFNLELLNTHLAKDSAKLVREYDKQVSSEFLNQLDYNVRSEILRAIRNAKSFRRLKASELLKWNGR